MFARIAHIAPRTAAFLLAATLAIPCATAQIQSSKATERWNCADDGSVDIAVNPGPGDKVISVTTSSTNDCAFVIEVYGIDAAGKEVLLDTVEHSCGSGPLITMPRGTMARARDPKDSDSGRPKGTITTH